MKQSIKYALNGVLAAAAVAVFVYVYASGTQSAGPTSGIAGTPPPQSSSMPATGGDKTIRIGWTAWADAEFVTKLARRLLQDRLGYHVDLVMSDIGVQYQGVANGDLDLMLMAWLPTTHRNYWRKVSGMVVDLGPLYLDARLGWVVPDYVPKASLDSLADLNKPAVKRELKDRIYGIDPGSGLMLASQKAIDGYGLSGYDLVASSGAGMTAALKRAIGRHRWVVATAWSPHWIFQKWHLRYLKDPKHLLGGREQIHAVARRGFSTHFAPALTAFLTRMYIPLPELEQAMLNARRDGVEQAVTRYIKDHPTRIDYWVDGRLPAPSAS
jgi:glycine betaine/proline transport system substrate-binding protein